jgi:hypothetical protein
MNLKRNFFVKNDIKQGKTDYYKAETDSDKGRIIS